MLHRNKYRKHDDVLLKVNATVMLRSVTEIAPCLDMQAAIEALYREFAAPTPRAIEGCPCCVAERGVDVLLTTPLREIPGEALWSYVSGVFFTVGNEQDFRYLLPRILDVSLNDPGNANNPEVVLGKLARANWQSWPAKERRTIEHVVDLWFEQALADGLSEADQIHDYFAGDAESVLCGAARAGLPLDHWLARLQEPFAEPILAQIKARYPRGLSGFWDDAPEGRLLLSALLAQV